MNNQLRSLCVIALVTLAAARTSLRGTMDTLLGDTSRTAHARQLHDAQVPRIATLDLQLKRLGDVTERPCRGLDSVLLILELRVAQMSGCSVTDVATTAVQCSACGVNATISFVTVAGRILGVNAASLGAGALGSVLDPLGTQFNLTLVRMHAHGHGLQSALSGPSDNSWDAPVVRRA